MQGLTPAQFLGSLPSPDIGGARLTWQLDLMCSCLAVLAAASIWLGSALGGAQADTLVLVKVSGLVLLAGALLGIWLMKTIVGRQRFGVAILLDAMGRQLSRRGAEGFAVQLAPAQTPVRGIAGLIGALVTSLRRPPDVFETEVRESRTEAQQIVTALYQDADTLTEVLGEIESTAYHLMADSRAAETSCDTAQARMSQVASQVVSLTNAVGATTAEVRRVAANAVVLSEQAFAGQRRVAGLDDRTAELMSGSQQIEGLLKRVGNLGQSAAVEAARMGEAGRPFAPIAAGIQELADATLKSIAAMQATVAEMSAQARDAARLALDVCDRVRAQHELGLALSYAVGQQGEEITGILRTLDEARSGFVTLRASVDAVSRHGIARLCTTDALRVAAGRLPSQADAVARLLREIPDFAPSSGFDL